jgi:hypothetical protein
LILCDGTDLATVFVAAPGTTDKRLRELTAASALVNAVQDAPEAAAVAGLTAVPGRVTRSS